MKNYYEILGVDENATQDDIKKAYRKLSKQYHPDVNPDGEEKFKDIAEAYDIIGDPEKRQDYENKKNNPFAGMGGHGFDIHSMFEQMMGGQMRKPKAPDKILELEVTPIESYFGLKKELELKTLKNCKSCEGSGGEKEVCYTCNGYGYVIQSFGTGMFQQQIQMTCNVCNGVGSTIKIRCNTCFGNGRVEELRKISVNIPKNVDNGDFLRLQNQGDYNKSTNTIGDLILKISMNENTEFQKSDFDLIYNKKISAIDVVIEDTMDIEHPEGKLRVRIPDLVESDKPLRIPNKGYKTQNGNGNFYIKLNIVKENNIDSNIKNKIKDLLKNTNQLIN